MNNVFIEELVKKFKYSIISVLNDEIEFFYSKDVSENVYIKFLLSDKKYNIRTEKLVQLFIKNVMNTPFAEFLIGSGKMHKITKDVRIEKLNKLDIEIKLNDTSYVSNEPYILEFNIIMNNNSKKLEEIEEKDIDTDEDLLSKVSNLMNFASN